MAKLRSEQGRGGRAQVWSESTVGSPVMADRAAESPNRWAPSHVTRRETPPRPKKNPGEPWVVGEERGGLTVVTDRSGTVARKQGERGYVKPQIA